MVGFPKAHALKFGKCQEQDEDLCRTYPASVVYVSAFGGYLLDDLTLSFKVKALKRALAADNLKFEEDFYFTASYDPPTRCAQVNVTKERPSAP